MEEEKKDINTTEKQEHNAKTFAKLVFMDRILTLKIAATIKAKEIKERIETLKECAEQAEIDATMACDKYQVDKAKKDEKIATLKATYINRLKFVKEAINARGVECDNEISACEAAIKDLNNEKEESNKKYEQVKKSKEYQDFKRVTDKLKKDLEPYFKGDDSIDTETAMELLQQLKEHEVKNPLAPIAKEQRQIIGKLAEVEAKKKEAEEKKVELANRYNKLRKQLAKNKERGLQRVDDKMKPEKPSLRQRAINLFSTQKHRVASATKEIAKIAEERIAVIGAAISDGAVRAASVVGRGIHKVAEMPGKAMQTLKAEYEAQYEKAEKNYKDKLARIDAIKAAKENGLPIPEAKKPIIDSDENTKIEMQEVKEPTKEESKKVEHVEEDR